MRGRFLEKPKLLVTFLNNWENEKIEKPTDHGGSTFQHFPEILKKIVENRKKTKNNGGARAPPMFFEKYWKVEPP